MFKLVVFVNYFVPLKPVLILCDCDNHINKPNIKQNHQKFRIEMSGMNKC
jgi:predicted acetyltransferase